MSHLSDNGDTYVDIESYIQSFCRLKFANKLNTNTGFKVFTMLISSFVPGHNEPGEVW